MLKISKVSFFLTAALMVMSIGLNAKSNNSSGTSSPYSRYGVGTRYGYSFGRSEAMGGIGIGLRNPFQVNVGNPASYTAIDSMTFLMEFGINSRFADYKTSDQQHGRNDINFNYLAFSFPLKKWWATAFGILPYSEKGYSIESLQETDNLLAATTISGNGTLSKVFWGNGFKIGNDLSIGVNAWYLFGNLNDSYYLYFPTDAASYDYLLGNSLRAYNFGFTLGAQYTFKTKQKNLWTVGATFEPKNSMNTKYIIHEERALFRSSSTTSPIIDTLQHVVSRSNGLTLPLTIGAGVSYTYKNKFTWGADVYHQNWKDSKFLGESYDYFANSTRYSTGLEYLPDEFSIKSYWDRAQYRFGAFYDNSYLSVNGHKIKGYGMTMGIGLPMSRSRSTLNISAELGKMGTTDYNLIKENYVKITFQLLLHDRWFMKRKFD